MHATSPSDLVRNLAAAAVAYALAGWLIFPLSTRGGRKAPLFPTPHRDEQGRPLRGHGCHGECGELGHGLYDATSDPATVAEWWSWHPTALVGCRVPERMLVLDVDPRGGGEDTLARLTAEHGPLPDTLTCYSGRGDGGRHLYLWRPSTPGDRLSGAKLRPGIDIIHHSLRYVVLPPSPHPKTGQPYWWAHPDAAVARTPAWLTALLTPPPPPEPRRALRVPSLVELYRPYTCSGTGTGSVAALVTWLERHDTADGSGRHDAVLWALSRAWELGATDDEMEAVCQAAEGIGKPRYEVDSMLAWVEGNIAAGAEL